jgi:MFS transporter, DHA1 family, inner membrane transport protein
MVSSLRPRFLRSRSADFSPEVSRALRIEISAAVLISGFMGLTAPFAALILRRDLGATPFQLAAMASGGAAFMLLSLLWARSATEQRPLPYVVWPALAARSLYLLFPLIHSAWAFVAIVVAGNFLGTVAGPAQAALVQRVYPKKQRGRALSRVRMAGALVGIVLVVAAGRLFGVIDYRWIFAGAAVLGMAGSLRLWQMPVPSLPGPEGAGRAPLRGAWSAVRGDHAFRRLLGVHFIFNCGIWIQMPANPLLVSDFLGATTSQVGLCAAVGAIAGLVAHGYWGRMADARGAAGTLRTVYLFGVVSALTYYVAWNPWMLFVISTAESFMSTGLDTVWMLAVIDAAGPRRTAQYAAISATLVGVRGLVAPVLGAVLIEHVGLHAVYLVSATTMLTAVWMVSREDGVAPMLGRESVAQAG